MSRDQAADTYFSMSEPERIASTARYDSQYSYTPRDMGHIEGFMYGVGKSAVGMATGAAKLAAYTVSGAYDAAVTTGGLAMWGITGDPGYATNAPTVNYAANSLNAVGRSLGRYGQAVGREHSSAGLVASSTFVAESVLRNIPIAGKVGSNIADIGVNGYSVQNTISFGESTFEIGSALGLARLSGVKWTRTPKRIAEQLDNAYHYTSSQWAKSINSRGLRPGSYATPSDKLTGLQAKLELSLNPMRPAPNMRIRINLGAMRNAGYKIPSPTRVSNIVKDPITGRAYTMPGGGYEMQFPYKIPSKYLEVPGL
ncbi:MAG: hypothetical protein DRP83_07450 [Planctomycetota bacterium]|nr:MAG: hypothetical protein DRP83_07450 [Planctomycetota bacterium]